VERSFHAHQPPFRKVLRHVGRELAPEDMPGRPPSGVVRGVDQHERRGAVEELVQIREVVVIIGQMEQYVHAEREFGGPLRPGNLGFVRGGEDELTEPGPHPVQDRRGHVNPGVRHVRFRPPLPEVQKLQDLAVPATPVDDARDAVLTDEGVDEISLVCAFFAFGPSAGGAPFAVAAVPVPARAVIQLHFVTPGRRTPTFGPGLASARRPACFSTLTISPASASAETAARTPGLVSVS